MKATAVLLACLSVAAACSPDDPTPAPVGPAPSSAIVAATALPPHDALDTRRPVPLLPMMANHQRQSMRDHLVAVQEIVAASATGDFAAIGAAAERIGFSESMGRMCSHMGAGAPGFTEQALDFHHRADRISAAARERDRDRVLLELGNTLQACTSCHQTWKQQIVDPETWERSAGMPAPQHVAP